MRFELILAMAACASLSMPAYAEVLTFDETAGFFDRQATRYTEDGYVVQGSQVAEYFEFELLGLHVDDAVNFAPTGWRISRQDGKGFSIEGVVQSCCATFDEGNGSERGSFSYYDAAGTLLNRIQFTPETAGTAYSLNWSGGSYILFSGDHVSIDNLSVAAVPEPATWALMILGMGAVGGAMRRRVTPLLTVR